MGAALPAVASARVPRTRHRLLAADRWEQQVLSNCEKSGHNRLLPQPWPFPIYLI